MSVIEWMNTKLGQPELGPRQKASLEQLNSGISRALIVEASIDHDLCQPMRVAFSRMRHRFGFAEPDRFPDTTVRK